jgi:hypothetical protein
MNKYVVRTASRTREFFTVISADSLYEAEDRVIDNLNRSVDIEYVDMQRQKFVEFNFVLCLN